MRNQIRAVMLGMMLAAVSAAGQETFKELLANANNNGRAAYLVGQGYLAGDAQAGFDASSSNGATTLFPLKPQEWNGMRAGLPKRDVRLAKAYMVKAVNLKEPRSMTMLGAWHMSDMFGCNNRKLGLQLLVAAAKQEEASAMDSLASAYNDPQKLGKMPVMALAWEVLAQKYGCPAGDAEAMALALPAGSALVRSALEKAAEFEAGNKLSKLSSIPVFVSDVIAMGAKIDAASR